MSGFKLLGIGTGKNFSEELSNSENYKNFFKVLESNQLYKFYSGFKFLDKNKQEISDGIEKVEFIQNESTVPNGLYNQADININLSAVVGKNGSGKSTLFEVFYISIYLLSVGKELLELNFSSINKKEEELNKQEQRFGKKINEVLTKDENYTDTDELISNIEERLDKIGEEYLKYLPNLVFLKKQLTEYKRLYDKNEVDYFTKKRLEYLEWSENISLMIESIDLKIYYQLKDCFYVLKIGNQENSNEYFSIETIAGLGEEKIKKNGIIKEIDLSDHFFYTIAVSYSHYGLNALEEGEWLNDIFHKNDSYQTPIVINPMRTNGTIDINREKKLVIQRLLSNILEPVDVGKSATLRHFTPNKKANKLILKFNHNKFEEYEINHRLSPIKNIASIAKLLYEQYTGSDFIKPQNNVHSATYYYAQNKIVRICGLYKRYQPFLQRDKFHNEDKLIKELIKDNSHITFKLKQALNFLKFDHIKWYPDREFGITEFEEDINDLSKRIKKLVEEERKRGRIKSTIEFLPPSIFDVKIALEDQTLFEKMSSGEKQKIYNLSSIVYHLINLNSVFNNNQEKNELIKYKYVNILLDEIEQYYHPEMQRTFIADLTNYIGKINSDNIDNIEGINILFATHSPFILSDIPSENILRLKDGKKADSDEKSFGANVYDLLKDSFFLEDGFMGAFAQKKIDIVIKWLNKKILEKEISALEKDIDEKIILGKKRSLERFETIPKLDKTYVYNLIEIVDEPLLKYKMKEMYYTIYSEEMDRENAMEQIQLIAKKSGLNVKFD
ncbi:putative AbiEii toxin of type IV toxin-antitoxin system [Leeuwenhoekiella aestuarii]|uniref:AAA family ATPase n=1 Tax=Leeuwenhoekiella aestuarii TaxID=2249426 RepID=UPI000FFEEBCE|nr:AAA family ATPase [Leeuwenhoekiella aestuarii]RXG15010.1 putative AbiEii toxin of type IV toxin-antitoxin system [Leeuwenhoekiella aestuarii]